MKILTSEKLKFRFTKEEQPRVLLDVCWVGSCPSRGNRESMTEPWKGVDCVLPRGRALTKVESLNKYPGNSQLHLKQRINYRQIRQIRKSL